MKIKLAFLFLFVLVLGCKKEDEMVYKPLHFENEKCADCPKVTIAIFDFLEASKIATTINTTLKNEVINQLLYDEETKVLTINDAIASFKNGYLDLKKMYPDETLGWEANIKGTILFENKDLISIQLETYIFTGGAHGYSATRFFNFDKIKGVQLENEQLFKKKDAFEDFAEIQFKIQEDIPQNASINSTGFMFEGDSFYLPANIGFTQEGIQLVYNQYEVASYADGPIVITLPYKEVNPFLAVSIKKE